MLLCFWVWGGLGGVSTLLFGFVQGALQFLQRFLDAQRCETGCWALVPTLLHQPRQGTQCLGGKGGQGGVLGCMRCLGAKEGLGEGGGGSWGAKKDEEVKR